MGRPAVGLRAVSMGAHGGATLPCSSLRPCCNPLERLAPFGTIHPRSVSKVQLVTQKVSSPQAAQLEGHVLTLEASLRQREQESAATAKARAEAEQAATAARAQVRAARLWVR